MDLDDHALDYLAQAHWHHFHYRVGELIGLDRAAKEIRLGATYDEEGRLVTPERAVPYDILVLAIGSRSNDFGTPGVAEHAIALDTPEQATRFHRRLVNACLRAHTQAEPVRPGQLHVAIIGAGATGTELSAELHRTARAVVAYGLDRIDPEKDIEITLIEARRPHPAGPARAPLGRDHRTPAQARRRRAHRRPRHRGHRRRRPARRRQLRALRARGLGRRRQGPRRAGRPGRPRGQPLQPARGHRPPCRPRATPTSSPSATAPGWCRQGQDRPLPPRAQTAHQQASHVLGQIRRRLKGQPLQPFVYRDFGSLVSLGHYSTVGSLMGFIVGKSMFIEGWFARLMYRSLYKMHQRALHGWTKVALDTFARTLTRRTEPHVKLH